MTECVSHTKLPVDEKSYDGSDYSVIVRDLGSEPGQVLRLIKNLNDSTPVSEEGLKSKLPFIVTSGNTQSGADFEVCLLARIGAKAEKVWESHALKYTPTDSEASSHSGKLDGAVVEIVAIIVSTLLFVLFLWLFRLPLRKTLKKASENTELGISIAKESQSSADAFYKENAELHRVALDMHDAMLQELRNISNKLDDRQP